MAVRRISRKVLIYWLLHRAKSPVFSTISFATIFFIIYAESIMSNLSLHNVASRRNENSKMLQSQTQDVGGEPMSTSTDHIPQLSMLETIDGADNENHNFPTPPFNVTKEERIAWFQKNLPEFEIFKSNNSTEQFHCRVLEFFNHECTVQFFMTWLSPAQSFGARELLAVESLFKSHPDGCLMILSRTLDSRRGSKILKPLLDFGFRVLTVAPDLPFLIKNTPAEVWFNDMKSGNKDPGEIPLAQNLSNLIRLAILYKYGGVYLDTDFIVLKKFTSLRNSIGAQSINMASKNWTRLNSAVLIFDRNHPLLLKFLEEFASTFNGNKWGHNGPYLVSRVIERVGTSPEYNFTILPPEAFYPVDWFKIGRIFKKPENIAESKWAEDKLLQLSRDTYGIHLWNKRSHRLRIEQGSVMGRLISDHCIICKDI